MGRIALLSDELINKIAAGEVVERPASVVKELCENALDAKARTLRVSVEEGGLARIRVADDGEGMSRGDAQASLQRHATSKLRDLEGLFSIHTLGFRGEALPSIASISRFTLTTSEAGAPVGTRLSLEGGLALRVTDAAPSPGTVIDVEDLFFNVPARRKFMRKAETEVKHVEDAVVRLALGHPEVAFFLDHGGRPLLSSPASEDLSERIAAALGKAVHPHLMDVHERRLGITVTGKVASPEYTLPNARGLYTFVNHRYVRDRGLTFAIQRAFSPLLAPGRQPVGVLFIEVDPATVDVNVHPQKLEVRFSDARGVADALHGGISRAVKSVPWLAAGGMGQGGTPEAGQAPAAAHYALAVDRFLSRAQGGLAPPPEAPFLMARELDRPPAFGEARPDRSAAPAPGFFSGLHYLGPLGANLWVCEGQGGTLTVVSAHTARERLHRTVFQNQVSLTLHNGTLPLPTLFSKNVSLPAPVLEAVAQRAELLHTLGFEMEPFGEGTLAVKALPPGLEAGALDVLLTELSTMSLQLGGSVESLAPAIDILACHAAQAAPRAPSHAEVTALLRQLDDADFELSCRHGVVVTLEMPMLELERRANVKS